MKPDSENEIPNEKWGLKRLGQFCNERRNRSAMDIVLIGRAIILAKVRCKREGKRFTVWKKAHLFTDASVSRYVRLAQGCKTDDDLERLKAVGPLQAYIDAGIEAEREHKPRQPSVRKGENSSAGVKEEPETPSWAVPDSEAPQVVQGDTERTIELVPVTDSVEHELREVVPWQVEHLRERVAFLMEQDAEVLRSARPHEPCDRTRMANEISALAELLSRLASMLRDEHVPQQAAEKTKKGKKEAA